MKLKKDMWANRWVRGEPLGPAETGQGRTYFAWAVSQPERQRSYVLKILKNQGDQERRKRMLREAAALRSLDHPGVARWADSNSDATHDDEELYLVTEFVGGPTLNQLVQSSTQSKEAAVSIVIGMLDALKYCHNRGLVHRDIKPDNIVLRDGNPAHPVLIDFGLTFNAGDEPDGLNTPDHRAIGSKFLRLPEFDMQGTARLSPVVDVTCTVGVLLYLLTGEVPRVLRDEHGQMPHRRLAVRAKLETQTRADLTILDSIFDVGFAHDQFARWQNCELLIAEMRRLEKSTGEPPATFVDQIKAIRRAMADNPTRKIEQQKKLIDDSCPRIADEVHQIFFNEMSGELASANASRYRGDRFFSVDLVDVTDVQRRVSLNIHRAFEGNEIAVLARVRRKSSLGSDGEISSEPVRINLFDPNAQARITSAVQGAFLFAWKHLGIPGT